MLQIMVYLYPSLQWGIGPSSFSHVENCGSKDPIVSFFFRRFSIYSVEPFRSRPIWALLVFIWPMFLSLFRESTTARHGEGKIHKRERHKGLDVSFTFLLPWPSKPIEASVSKVFGVSFNQLFGRFHCGGFGFVKRLKW